jgi:hypothetical protein
MRGRRRLRSIYRKRFGVTDDASAEALVSGGTP